MLVCTKSRSAAGGTDVVEESIDRQRLLEHEVAAKFLAEIVGAARSAKLMSDDHFTVDGTLIEAWASTLRQRQRN